MRATQTNSKPDPTDRPRILLMEDEAIVARGYQMALMEEGYGVDWATTGEAALDAIDRNGCDLLVADLRLPDMDGMQVIERIKQTRPEIGVIVVTGYAEVASAVQALKAGVHDYLCKPLTEQAFIKAVAQALSQKHKDPPFRDRSQSVKAAKENVIRKNEVVRALKVSLTDNRLLAPGRSDGPLPDDGTNTPEDATATPVSFGATVDESMDRQLRLEKNLIENAVEWIMAWESNGTITVFKKRMQAMLGYAQEETIGRMPPSTGSSPWAPPSISNGTCMMAKADAPTRCCCPKPICWTKPAPWCRCSFRPRCCSKTGEKSALSFLPAN